MSKIKFKNVKFNDMFNLKRGQVISKEYMNKNSGKYPVYSTQVDDAFGYIDTYMYDGKFLIWNTDGIAGYVRVINGKFSITNIVGMLTFKETFNGANISLEYIKNIIEPIFRVNIKGRIGENGKNEYTKLNSTMIKKLDILIPIPIRDNGEYDLEIQEDIALKYEKINIKKNILLEKKRKIEEIEITFLEGLNTKEVKIIELFTPVLGNGKYTKEFCMNNKGIYPVYSGNTVGSFNNINEYTYEGEYLTWAKDGLAGYLMYHNEKFSITNHRGLLVPTELCTNIDLEYIKIILEPIFRKSIKGRLGLEGKNEYTTLSKDMINKIEDKMLIPINAEGSFDLEKQKEIAQKYNNVKYIKNNIIMKIEEIINKELIF
ncbi:MAG: restriction endonuclease subunit S [Clostridium perfringens]|nr:restriction endonuclease subunit S [Clostridium perfringens]